MKFEFSRPKSSSDSHCAIRAVVYMTASPRLFVPTGHTIERDGFVQILPQRGCQCSDVCVWIDYTANKYKCQCLNPNTELAEDGEDCVLRKYILYL